MNLKDIFSFQKTNAATQYSLELSFRLPHGNGKTNFADVFVYELFRKILTDCYRHAADFPDGKQETLWDSMVSAQARWGLISLLARAMTNKQTLYLVLDSGVVRCASEDEKKDIEKNPSKKGQVCVDFSQYHRATILLNLASLIELLLLNANASLNVSKSVLVKIAKLRESIATLNSTDAVQQAKDIARGLKEGKGALLDAGDSVELPAFDTAPMEAALEVIYGFVSMVSGMPRPYICGEATESLNATGESDELAVERGLEYYFNSIFSPVCAQLLGTKLLFKTSTWRKFAQVANFLPVIEASEIIPQETKDRLIKELFG